MQSIYAKLWYVLTPEYFETKYDGNKVFAGRSPPVRRGSNHHPPPHQKTFLSKSNLAFAQAILWLTPAFFIFAQNPTLNLI